MLKFDFLMPLGDGRHDPLAIGRAVITGAMRLRNAVRELSPYGKTGALIESWKIAQVGANSVRLFSDSKVALWLEYGTKRHPIDRSGAPGVLGSGFRLSDRRRIYTDQYGSYNYGEDTFEKTVRGKGTGRRFLRFDDSRTGEEIFVTHVMHPGIDPRLYFLKAQMAIIPEITEDIRYVAGEVLAEELFSVIDPRYSVSGRTGRRFYSLRTPRSGRFISVR